MASAELVLAAVAGADLCLKYGKKLVDLYQAFRQANEDIKAMVLYVEAIWMRTTVQIGFLVRVLNSLREEHCQIYLDVFDMLQRKLAKATAKIDSVTKREGSQEKSAFEVRRWKYVLVRDTLDNAIADLERWQHIFEPTWYLVLRVANENIDSSLATSSVPLPDHSWPAQDSSTAVASISSPTTSLDAARSLRKVLKHNIDTDIHITLSAKGLRWETAMPLPYSTVQTIQRAGSPRTFLMDSITCHSGVDISQARDDATALAKKLKQIEPDTFQMLTCHGLVKRKDEENKRLRSVELIFRLPMEEKIPTSLRAQLLSKSPISLTRILKVACHLAEAVSFIHTCDFVHKNIRPETILIFPDPESTLGSAYLMGFDSFRRINFHTLRRGDTAWERNLYRHPLRQGLHTEDSYSMQHDIYSLGVCLLELGLWESFVDYTTEDVEAAMDTIQTPSGALGMLLQDLDYNSEESPKDGARLKDHLTQMAQSRLPARMGDKYTKVVTTCLTCLDEDNEDFGDEAEMMDEDGIMIGVRFIEKVLFRLNSISL